MEYKLIKKFLPELILNVPVGGGNSYVYLSDLEAELAKGVEFFGLYDVYTIKLSFGKHEADTHSGLLIGYQPISKQVSKSELMAALGNSDLARRIEKYGISND